jgi:small subunit ribosomal protein S8
MTDPITDMLNQIKSGYAVSKTEILISLSNIKSEIAEILSKEGFVGEIKKTAKGGDKTLKISLKYDNGIPAMSDFKRVSKPGQRIYEGFSEIKKVHGGYGIAIISTSKGLMTNKDAKIKKIGGEIICKIW